MCMSAAQLKSFGLREDKARVVSGQLNEEFILERLGLYRKESAQIITIYDADYPPILKQVSQPPWILYALGRMELLGEPSIGIVGTRTPTAYGKKMAESLSFELSQAGMAVVSGLARGIDTEAHLGALKGKAGTIAVLGCPVDQVYPPENLSLYRDIAAQGVLISEYPIGTKVHPGLFFPLRNRIIAGLSLGVLVVEAAERSGSLITADQAMEESRDVYAVPGPATSPKSRGTLQLIKQGAKMVTEAGDILEEYGYALPSQEVESSRQIHTILTNEEQLVYDLIHSEILTFDSLLETTRFDFGHLHAVLLSLILKKQGKITAWFRIYIDLT